MVARDAVLGRGKSRVTEDDGLRRVTEEDGLRRVTEDDAKGVRKGHAKSP